jgi:hypothetical protein
MHRCSELTLISNRLADGSPATLFYASGLMGSGREAFEEMLEVASEMAKHVIATISSGCS